MGVLRMSDCIRLSLSRWQPLPSCQVLREVYNMRYRNHLILTTPSVDAATGAWKAIAHIEFTQGGIFNNVVIRSSALFKSRKAAEKQLLREAKEWVDNRLRKGPIAEV